MTEGLYEGGCDRGFVGGRLWQRVCRREAVTGDL